MTDAAERGSLQIAPKVVERIAEISSREVAGVIRSTGGGIGRVMGRSYPSGDAKLAGQRGVLELDIAVAWPTPAQRVGDEVADHVRSSVKKLAAVDLDRIGIRIAHVEVVGKRQGRRVQ